MMPVVTSYAAFKRMTDETRAQYLAERRALGMRDRDIFKEAGFSARDRERAYKYLAYRQQYSAERPRQCSTLCWDCSRALGGCSWSLRFEPVEGWIAEATQIRNNTGYYTKSYRVISCPLFKR